MSEPWFKPKRYGYGAGLPIRWQGWALLAAYFACVFLALHFALAQRGDLQRTALGAAIVLPTVVLIFIARAKTEGGWRWRN